MFPSSDDFEFIPPPEAPVFEPDEEEWKDPLAYIAKIHPYAVKVGICKIRPPPDWQPTFSVDVDKFSFTPRIQKLNELEAKTRVKLNFMDAIAKFWELQGSVVKLPNVEKKSLDLHLLHKIVQSEGGYEDVTRLRRWSRVALLMGYSSAQSSAMLRRHYEKILYPYDVFMSGAMTGDTRKSNLMPKQPVSDIIVIKDDAEEVDGDESLDYAPPSYTNNARRSRYKADSIDSKSDVDYSKSSELKKLEFLAPGPKITGNKYSGRSKKQSGKYNQADYEQSPEIKAIQGLTRRKPPTHIADKQDTNIFDVVASWVDNYKCQVCENGDDEDSMLLCDSCDSSYHTFCLIPPLVSIPPGDWRCPKCLAKECNKPTEAFGFEQAKKKYTLQEFGVMANKFKEGYFSMPTHEVPPHVTEKEFWRLVSSLEDDVTVEYGADLHTADHGSGFPLRENTDDPDDEDYISSPWNLNNIPNNDKSVLKYISQDISGMKVPWLYIGMCFSCFCWHTEDHWSYSINYMHWGEPKTWYGVPESEAEKLEACVKSIAPELFEKHPDLLHHLVTQCSPTTLMNFGVPVVRTNQYAGEFVVTFPRAYHSGFNQGYNCAEAVNFCPADWLVTGQQCIEHYRILHRSTVFSHTELVCKMATVPETLDLDLAKKLYENMQGIVDKEIALRSSLHEKGIKDRQREAFELIPDDLRQCEYCKTTCFFSAVICTCNNKVIVCLHHVDETCVCQNFKKFIRYRYTLDELPTMLEQLKKRADSFDNWEKEVQKAMSCDPADKLDLSAFKEFITEAEESQFPDCELLEQIKTAVVESEQCAQVANQLLTKKHKTRKTSTSSAATTPRLSLDELKEFVQQVQTLPCLIKEVEALDNLMAQVASFRYDAKAVLRSEEYNESKVIELLEHADIMDIELPEINDLRLDLKAAKWLDHIEEVLNQDEPISLDVIRGCVDQGIGLRKKQASEKPLSRLKELLYAADRWEEKAKLCLQAKPRHMMGTLEVIVQEAAKVKIILPNVSALKEALKKGKEWSAKVDKIQNDDYYPYYDILEALVTKGRPIPVRLEQLPQMESQVAAARAWKDRTARTFVKKGSNRLLIEILRPRKDIGRFENKAKKKKITERGETSESKDKKEKSDKVDCKMENKEKVKDKKDKSNREKKEKSSGRDKNEKERSSKASKESKGKKHDTEQRGSVENPQGDTKPVGLPVEAINIDDYSAPDPLTVADSLKQDEDIELRTMRELHINNIEKVKNKNIEGPYCSCRKPIDGYMLRCNLCYEWYHSSCIIVPKNVHGKPLGKGFTPWGAAREARYICTLCCRTRRPRLDTILSLLMSLQKLPVRVAEGEALQFLTERSMNWQDRAKQTLSYHEIQRVLNEVKREVESVVVDKQTNVTQAAIIQKLICIQKVHGIKIEKQVKADENIEIKTENSEPNSINSEDTIKKENDAELECTEKMGGSPVAIKDPQVTQLQSGQSSRAQSPIDVCTLADVSKTLKDPSKITTMSPLPDAVLDQLEELMFEGDLLEVGLDEVPIMWALLQIQRPLLKEDCIIMNAEYRRKLVKDRKKQRKRKCEDVKPVISPVPNASKSLLNIIANKAAAKKLKSENKATVKVEEGSPKDADDDEDDCSAKPCHKPMGEEVQWVQCDTCENWYHVVCVGISAQEADSADEYVCPYCKPLKIKTEDKMDIDDVVKVDGNMLNVLPQVSHLNAIAEVAHKLIADAENNKNSPAESGINTNSTNNVLDLNSLICLADVSQKMDVAPVPCNEKVINIETESEPFETKVIPVETDIVPIETEVVDMEIENNVEKETSIITTTSENSVEKELVRIDKQQESISLDNTGDIS